MITIIGILVYLRREIDDEDFVDNTKRIKSYSIRPPSAFAGPPATAEPVVDPR